jgi:hypothetical protein
MNLLENLLKKAQQGSLAHFYIVETSAPESEALKVLLDFTHDFIRGYYHQVEGQKQSLVHLMDHPDVYVLGNLAESDDKEGKFFSVLESEEFARFFEFKSVQGGRKFAVITEAHRINPIVANKWLKLLEEPQGQSTIILLNPRRQKLLDTIHSRAQHLRLPFKAAEADASEWQTFLLDIKKLGLAAFLEKYLKGERDLIFWNQQLIKWESEQTDQSQSKAALQNWLKKVHEMEVFHQPHATKWTLFYSYLHEHVLPRASH